MLDESRRIARLIGETLDLPALRVPLIHLRLLLPIAVKTIPGESEHICNISSQPAFLTAGVMKMSRSERALLSI
jgi:hypothetical protein